MNVITVEKKQTSYNNFKKAIVISISCDKRESVRSFQLCKSDKHFGNYKLVLISILLTWHVKSSIFWIHVWKYMNRRKKKV